MKKKMGFCKKELIHLFVHLFTKEYLSAVTYIPDIGLLSRLITMGSIAVVFSVTTQTTYYMQIQNSSNDGLKYNKVNTGHCDNSPQIPLRKNSLKERRAGVGRFQEAFSEK